MNNDFDVFQQNKKNIKRKGYKYIYNMGLANFLMINGVVCRGTGVNKKTGSHYWCFNYNECQNAYDKWEENKNNNNN